VPLKITEGRDWESVNKCSLHKTQRLSAVERILAANSLCQLKIIVYFADGFLKDGFEGGSDIKYFQLQSFISFTSSLNLPIK
jgi:hypothetical protein